MQVVYERCAAIDVHQKTAVTTTLITQANGQVQKETRTFATMTSDLLRLDDWLHELGITVVAMERVLPLSTVDNSSFSPNRLTTLLAPLTLPLINKLSVLFISSKEDSYEPSCVLTLVLGLVPSLSGTALSSFLAPSWPSPLESSSEDAHHGPTSP
jgi:hypothetical protein